MADKNEPNERPCCVCSDVAIPKGAPAFICHQCLIEFYDLRREAAYKSEFGDSPEGPSIAESLALVIAPSIKKFFEEKASLELRKTIEVTSYCANCGNLMLPEMKICPTCWCQQWVKDKPSLLPVPPSTHPEFMPPSQPAPAEEIPETFGQPKCLDCGCPLSSAAKICPRCLGHRFDVRMKADD